MVCKLGVQRGKMVSHFSWDISLQHVEAASGLKAKEGVRTRAGMVGFLSRKARQCNGGKAHPLRGIKP